MQRNDVVLAPGATFEGRYKIIARLGEGGFGTVHKARQLSTGQLIAEPEFYQHANKMGGAWSFGANDKAMLIRISSMVTDYLQKNYAQAVGGSTSVATDVKF